MDLDLDHVKNQIGNSVPEWATEDTLRKLSVALTKYDDVMPKSKDFKPLQSAQAAAINAQNRATAASDDIDIAGSVVDAIGDAANELQSGLGDLEGSSNPLGDLGKIAAAAGSSVTKLVGAFVPATTAASAGARIGAMAMSNPYTAGAIAVAAIGTLAVSAHTLATLPKLAEHTQLMLDNGIMTLKDTEMAQMRHLASLNGILLEQLVKDVLPNVQSINRLSRVALTENDINASKTNNLGKLMQLQSEMKGNELFDKLGMGSLEFTQLVAMNADYMIRSGEIMSLQNINKARFGERFNKIAILASKLSAITGEERQKMLAELFESLTSEEGFVNAATNAQYVFEQSGRDVADVRVDNELFLSMLRVGLGKDIGDPLATSIRKHSMSLERKGESAWAEAMSEPENKEMLLMLQRTGNYSEFSQRLSAMFDGTATSHEDAAAILALIDNARKAMASEQLLNLEGQQQLAQSLAQQSEQIDKVINTDFSDEELKAMLAEADKPIDLKRGSQEALARGMDLVLSDGANIVNEVITETLGELTEVDPMTDATNQAADLIQEELMQSESRAKSWLESLSSHQGFMGVTILNPLNTLAMQERFIANLTQRKAINDVVETNSVNDSVQDIEQGNLIEEGIQGSENLDSVTNAQLNSMNAFQEKYRNPQITETNGAPTTSATEDVLRGRSDGKFGVESMAEINPNWLQDSKGVQEIINTRKFVFEEVDRVLADQGDSLWSVMTSWTKTDDEIIQDRIDELEESARLLNNITEKYMPELLSDVELAQPHVIGMRETVQAKLAQVQGEIDKNKQMLGAKSAGQTAPPVSIPTTENLSESEVKNRLSILGQQMPQMPGTTPAQPGVNRKPISAPAYQPPTVRPAEPVTAPRPAHKPAAPAPKPVAPAPAPVAPTPTPRQTPLIEDVPGLSELAKMRYANIPETWHGKDAYTYHPRQRQAFEYLLSKGMDPMEAAAAIGNFITESGPSLNPSLVGDKHLFPGQPEKWAVGIAQWREDRRQNFERVVGTAPENATLEQNLDFFLWEQENTYTKGWYNNVERVAEESNNDPLAITRAFDQYYERSDGSHRELRVIRTASFINEYAEILRKEQAARPAPVAPDIDTSELEECMAQHKNNLDKAAEVCRLGGHIAGQRVD